MENRFSGLPPFLVFQATVTVQVIVSPFVVLAVMVAIPADFAVTVPSDETSAMVGASLLHVTDLSGTLSGKTVAVSFTALPGVKFSEV